MTHHSHTTKRPQAQAQRMAAAAPDADEGELLDLEEGDQEMHDLFESWASWRATRRYYVPPAGGGNVLGKLRGATRPSRPAPDAACSAQMAAINLAINAQPRDEKATQVFLLYYVDRVRSIKTVADYLGISRVHFYRLRRAFGRRVIIAAKQIEAEARAAGEAMPHNTPISGGTSAA